MTRRPSWLTVALVGAGGFLFGVLLVAVLGGPKGVTRTTTTTAVVTRTTTRTVAVDDGQVGVPDVTGQALDEARAALEDRGFHVETDGGGLFGVIVESDYVVDDQDPPGDTRADPGSTVTLRVSRG